MPNVIFIAPPAAGKGTISSYLVDNLGYTQLSTGDILRKVAETNEEIKSLMAAGKFISDEIMFDLIKEEIEKVKGKPFILDGIPRNVNQAEFLTNLLKNMNVDNYVVINIDVPESILEKRVTGRLVCPKCGASYNIYFEDFKPQKENTCDKCLTELIKRSDDSLETFKTRYTTYLTNTVPVISYYEQKAKLVKIDGTKDNSEIKKDVLKILGRENHD